MDLPQLPVPSVAESVLQTSVFAAIFVVIKNRITDTPTVQRHSRNRLTTTTTTTLLTILLLLLLLLLLLVVVVKFVELQYTPVTCMAASL